MKYIILILLLTTSCFPTKVKDTDWLIEQTGNWTLSRQDYDIDFKIYHFSVEAYLYDTTKPTRKLLATTNFFIKLIRHIDNYGIPTRVFSLDHDYIGQDPVLQSDTMHIYSAHFQDDDLVWIRYDSTEDFINANNSTAWVFKRK